MSPLDKAIKIAVDAHAGQVDKAGEPYILHPLRVMLAMHDPVHCVVAVLHDVMEDSNVCLDDLDEFGVVVRDAVDALTRREGEAYRDYIHRLSANPIARTVKWADLQDNLREDRGPISMELRARYEGAVRDLEAVMSADRV